MVEVTVKQISGRKSSIALLLHATLSPLHPRLKGPELYLPRLKPISDIVEIVESKVGQEELTKAFPSLLLLMFLKWEQQAPGCKKILRC